MADSRIFVSYRRKDSAGFSGRIADHLERRFGRDAVFRDVVAIECGADFADVIDTEVSTCKCLVVVIGPAWLHLTDEQGVRRLDRPDDFVRLEIARALARKIRVLPVLVEETAMPSVDQLPYDLQGLVRRQAIRVSDDRFAEDMARLIRTLEAADRSARAGGRARAWLDRRVAAAGLACLAVLAALVVWQLAPLRREYVQAERETQTVVTPATDDRALTQQAMPAMPSSDNLAAPQPQPAAPKENLQTGAREPSKPQPSVAAAIIPAKRSAPERPRPDPEPDPEPTVPPPAPVKVQQPTNSMTGVWDGRWYDEEKKQTGKLHVEVNAGGAVTGSMTNEVANQAFRIVGSVANGTLGFECVCSAQFEFKALGHLDFNAEVASGRLGFSAGGAQFGNARTILRRASLQQ